MQKDSDPMAHITYAPALSLLERIFGPLVVFYGQCVEESLHIRNADLLRLSDAELAAKGLKRPELVDRHFGDLFYS